MKFKKSKIFVTLLLSLTMFIGTCVPASAYTTYYSTWRYADGLASLTFRFRSYMEIHSEKVVVGALMQTTSGGYAMPDWMEEMALLYNSNGTLKYSSGMIKNWVSTSSFRTERSVSDAGTYYATGWYGLADDFEKTSYTVYFGTNTSTVSFSPSALDLVSDSPEGYAVNSNGETYGSGLLAEVYNEAPDLVEAEGVNGTIGYVRYDDLILSESDSIPVYDLSGNVIDTFEFSVVEDDELIPADPTPIEPIV